MVENWLLPESYRFIQLEKIAKSTQLSFAPKDEFGLINLLKDFRLFQISSEKKIVNILSWRSQYHNLKIIHKLDS